MSFGAKANDEDWESAEKITQQKMKLVTDDVVDDWEQQLDDEPKPEPAPAPAPSKEKPAKKETKQSKAKATEKSEATGEPVRELTKEEQLRAILESEKEIIREQFGISDSSNAKEPFRIDTFAPKDAADFKTLANAVVERCGQFKSSEQFSSFAEQIVRGICQIADMKDARRINQLLTADIDTRNKAEKAKSKAGKKGGKLQLGNAVKIGGKGGKGVDMRVVNDEFDDFYGPSGSAAAQRSDDDDDDETKPAAAAPAAPTAAAAAVATREAPKKERVPVNFDEEGFI